MEYRYTINLIIHVSLKFILMHFKVSGMSHINILFIKNFYSIVCSKDDLHYIPAVMECISFDISLELGH